MLDAVTAPRTEPNQLCTARLFRTHSASVPRGTPAPSLELGRSHLDSGSDELVSACPITGWMLAWSSRLFRVEHITVAWVDLSMPT